MKEALKFRQYEAKKLRPATTRVVMGMNHGKSEAGMQTNRGDTVPFIGESILPFRIEQRGWSFQTWAAPENRVRFVRVYEDGTEELI